MNSLKVPNEPNHQIILIEEDKLLDNPKNSLQKDDCLDITFKTPLILDSKKDENKIENKEKLLKHETLKIAKLTSLVIYSLFSMSTLMFLFHSFQIKNNKF